MNELIKVNYDNPEKPVVSGRELHEALGIKTAYKDWFPRMCEYGFKEGIDFCSFLSESTGGRPATDHMLTIPMAKELCMIQRTDIGRKFRQYFISIEEAWNSPEMVMQRALSQMNVLRLFSFLFLSLLLTIRSCGQKRNILMNWSTEGYLPISVIPQKNSISDRKSSFNFCLIISMFIVTRKAS